MDGSPRDLRVVASVDGDIVAWLADGLSQHDVEARGHEIGSFEGRQMSEALVMFVSLRTWADLWKQERAILESPRSNRSSPPG